MREGGTKVGRKEEILKGWIKGGLYLGREIIAFLK